MTSPPTAEGAELVALGKTVDMLEVRADLVGDLDPAWLRDRFPGELLYTLRSRAEGGKGESNKLKRRQRLVKASAGYDLVDLEGERDLSPELLVETRAERRLISWHGPATHLTGLRQRFEHLAGTLARYYKLIPTVASSGEGVQPLALLDSLRREDVISFGSGEMGTWTRLLAPRLGSTLVYGSFGEEAGAPGQLSIDRLVGEYGLPFLPELQNIFGILGCPVSHSRSPMLHNGAYRAFGLPYLYLPFHVETFADFWIDVVEAGSLEVLGFPLKGLSVTAPFKEVALAVSGASSPRAQHISAANTMVKTGNVWEAETTDPDGVILPLERRGLELAGRRAAVVGCGGAGRAAAYGLQLQGAEVTLVNRTEERGEKASIEMALPFVPLAEFDPGSYEVVVHATALGHKQDDPLPFEVDRLLPGAAVVDLIYDKLTTPLVKAARRRGLIAIDGLEVLFRQALEQFRLMTGHELNEALARDLLDIEEAP